MLFSIGAVGSLIVMKRNTLANIWGNTFAVFGSIVGLVSAVAVLFGSGFSFSFETSLPFLSLSVHVDKLSAFFIFVISLIAAVASVYGIGYVKQYYGKYNIGALGFFYNAFIAGMIMVVSAQHALFFLVVWEIMSLASYFLVIFENNESSHVRAGTLYFVMTHIGTAFITLAFLLLYSATGSFDFAMIKENSAGITPFMKDAIFILALIGFGTKAGIIPLHIWLPSAHPAAPTHISALMSGVMIKTGIYMFIRLFVEVLPNTPLWWGIVVLIIGAVSSLLGVLYAITEHDIKKLLAYHSIENIGIILLGLGSSLIFLAFDMKSLATLGLVASLFHIFNHATFKALLFLAAGSVISKTHTRNMEDYGGLIKLMPQTALFFLIGAMAISALPPFNGFFSEWMTFQSLFAGIRSADTSVQWAFILAAGSLAFTGGLAAACFVKTFGIIFLARPRSEHAKSAHESSVTLRFGMAVLALLTLAIGLSAGPIAVTLSKVAGDLNAFAGQPPAFAADWSAITLVDNFASVSGLLIFAMLTAFIFIVFFAVSIFTKNRKVHIGRTWDCGTNLDSRMEITATGFSRSLINIFRGVLKPTKQVTIEYRDEHMRYFHVTKTVEFGIRDIYQNYFYELIQLLVAKISEQMRRMQSGNVNVYVAYIIVALITLLVIMK
ncbi:hydrogenase 4 subunit B [Candidatus Uhrbacteria bacterium]|nr:hydrogenase 4 subunit B [Candidatus Uhrbacteria bacterium]